MKSCGRNNGLVREYKISTSTMIEPVSMTTNNVVLVKQILNLGEHDGGHYSPTRTYGSFTTGMPCDARNAHYSGHIFCCEEVRGVLLCFFCVALFPVVFICV